MITEEAKVRIKEIFESHIQTLTEMKTRFSRLWYKEEVLWNKKDVDFLNGLLRQIYREVLKPNFKEYTKEWVEVSFYQWQWLKDFGMELYLEDRNKQELMKYGIVL